MVEISYPKLGMMISVVTVYLTGDTMLRANLSEG